jgi:hypothetical protein
MSERYRDVPAAATVEEIAARIMRHCLEIHHVNASKHDGFVENCYQCQCLQRDLDAVLTPELSESFKDRVSRGFV